jgi:hypothetical protein
MQGLPAVESTLPAANRVDQSRRLLDVALATNATLQILASGILAGYPWAHLLGRDYVFNDWTSWLVVVGLHSLWVLALAPRGYFATLLAIVLAAVPSVILVVGLAITLPPRHVSAGLLRPDRSRPHACV